MWFFVLKMKCSCQARSAFLKRIQVDISNINEWNKKKKKNSKLSNSLTQKHGNEDFISSFHSQVNRVVLKMYMFFFLNACLRNPIFHFVNAFEWKHTNIDWKLLNLEKKPTYFDVLMEWMCLESFKLFNLMWCRLLFRRIYWSKCVCKNPNKSNTRK